METEAVRRDRSLVSDSFGRIWISLLHSLAVADVTEAKGYSAPVRVRVDLMSPAVPSESKRYLNLPSGTSGIAFRYAATNMSMPQRIRFRYRLDGSDQTWSVDNSSRQVVYTHLSPGNYTFRIMASNAMGLWNGPESDVAFNIQPALSQTWYFRTLTILALMAFVAALYRIRLMQVTGQLNRRFQDRLAERTRIAQDLHDTLLQGVISASMQLDLAQDHLPEDSPAKPLLGRVLQLMRHVTGEGREALRGLRAIESSASLEETFRRLVTEIVPAPTSENIIHVQGHPRPLRAAVVDEVYRIGREAYINAAAHAGASRIEITIDYGLRTFRLLVSDNGCGIDAGMLNNGRDGHWGLAGMRERAKAIGSVLRIRSQTPGGTDVELVIPAKIANSFPASLRRLRWPWQIQRNYPEPQEETRRSR
jgi:signal transduction histidine kinase